MASSIEINRRVVVTCAVTGAGDTVGKHPAIPVTPRQIAEVALEAASVGAAVAHIHVRDPETGKTSRDPALYREVVDRIRASGSDVIVNLGTAERLGVRWWIGYDRPSFWRVGDQEWDGFCAWWKPGSMERAAAST
jgi:hypothetical protein